MISEGFWSEWGDSNARSLEPKSSAIPPSLHPDIQFSAMIAEGKGKSKFNLSVVNPVVKEDFQSGFVVGKNPANAAVSETSGASMFRMRIGAPTLPNHPCYQLHHTRILNFPVLLTVGIYVVKGEFESKI